MINIDIAKVCIYQLSGLTSILGLDQYLICYKHVIMLTVIECDGAHEFFFFFFYFATYILYF